jgi:hypothetical protein
MRPGLRRIDCDPGRRRLIGGIGLWPLFGPVRPYLADRVSRHLRQHCVLVAVQVSTPTSFLTGGLPVSRLSPWRASPWRGRPCKPQSSSVHPRVGVPPPGQSCRRKEHGCIYDYPVPLSLDLNIRKRPGAHARSFVERPIGFVANQNGKVGTISYIAQAEKFG